MANFKNAKKELKEKQEKSLTAAQRIEVLEKTVQTLRKMIEVMATEMDKIQQSQIAIAQRLDATLKVATEGELSEKNVDTFIVDQEVRKLKAQIDVLVSQGVFIPSETVEESSFVVGRELDKEGNVSSPRTQAPVASLPEEVKEKLIGSKVGDLVTFSEDKLSFQVDEIFSIVMPEQNQPEELTAGA
jgi:hypothetical protein